jgi:hypothetical protein
MRMQESLSYWQGFGMAVAFFATLMTADQVATVNRGLRSRGWNTTRGRVVDEGLCTVRWRFGKMNTPALLYEYVVDGETYRNDVISHRGSIFRSAARAVLARYRRGQRVTVYYDPDHPQLAVLEPGSSFGGFCRVVVSLGVIGLGLWMFYGNPPS